MHPIASLSVMKDDKQALRFCFPEVRNRKALPKCHVPCLFIMLMVEPDSYESPNESVTLMPTIAFQSKQGRLHSFSVLTSSLAESKVVVLRNLDAPSTMGIMKPNCPINAARDR